jgi:hypothetical protein
MNDTPLRPSLARPAATALDGSYPRPQLVRGAWADLGGSWDFAYDDEGVGTTQRWFRSGHAFPHQIEVPFPPESPASGIGARGFHPVVWYRRVMTREHLRAAGLGTQGERLLLHFGAVDYRADVWVDEQYVGQHEGGHTPFSFDVTDRLDPAAETWAIAVRAADDPADVAQPRGKQDWQPKPHGIWYQRTTGIWQPVWIEAVPTTRVADLAWVPDLTQGSVQMRLELPDRPVTPVTVKVRLHYQDHTMAEIQFQQTEPRSSTLVSLPHQANGQAYEALLWTPEHPRLVDATVQLDTPAGESDVVTSYLGLRSAGWAGQHFMLNDRPYFIRAVLEQGYWPETHLAAPSAAALREEVQLAKDLGFNAVRVHEKVEDPRYLYWADRLGLLVWGESASAYEFSTTAIERSVREWMDIVRRDMSHPCIVTWVPLNESWGVPHIAHDPAQLDYARSLYHLTKALDPSRPVISNDGWEHADSDLLTIHDYSFSGKELAANYADRQAIDQVMSGIGPLGRRIRLLDSTDQGQPVIVSEFGGISYAPTSNGGISYAPASDGGWGYLTASQPEEFEHLLRDQFQAVQSSPVLAGFCYTQLTDTLQEANGLADPSRQLKLPAHIIRDIVLGVSVDISSHRRPKVPVERPLPSPTQPMTRSIDSFDESHDPERAK